jgi:hypothetical protein
VISVISVSSVANHSPERSFLDELGKYAGRKIFDAEVAEHVDDLGQRVARLIGFGSMPAIGIRSIARVSQAVQSSRLEPNSRGTAKKFRILAFERMLARESSD